MPVFAIMPIQAFLDDRLSKTDLRVLGAILSFSDRKTGACWPKREQLAERCGLSLPKISTATSSLVELGWLVKEGDGGRSRSTHYKCLTPTIGTKTVPDSGTVPKIGTVPDSGTKTVPDSGTVPKIGTVPDSGTKTVPDSGTGIKQTNEQTKVTTTSAKPKKVKVATNPKAKITCDWQPGDRCMELIARAGISIEFAGGLVDEYVLYWEERGDKRSGWEATFVNHAKKQWEWQQQKSQLDRTGSEAGFDKNLRGNYDTKNRNNEARTGAGRKLCLVDEAQLAIDRIEAREIREQQDRARIVN
jgi:hypothetical protein